MKNSRQIILLLLLVILSLNTPQQVSAEDAKISQAPETLCLPGVYLDEEPKDCSVLGPAEQLTYTAWIQAEIDSQPERYVQIDESWGQTDFKYLKINPDNPRRVYASLDDAVEGGKSYIDTLPEGFVFVSYINQVTVDSKAYFELSNGYWIRSGAVIGFGEPSLFRGVLMESTPPRKFGWLLKDVTPYEKPGFYEKQSDQTIDRHTLIEVFEEVKVGWTVWYMIGPNQWIDQSQTSVIYPNSTPPKGVRNLRWIEINLFEQSIAVYNKGEMVFATLTTTGAKRTPTRPGLFKIYEFKELTSMAGGVKGEDYYFLQDVPWSMYFDERRALHGQYWHDHLGYYSSHGCANLSFPDAEWLYNWATYGDWVYVWDPSGATPEDPSLFEP